MNIQLAGLVGLLAVATSASCKEGPTLVYLQTSTNGTKSERFSFELKEGIRQSASLKLADEGTADEEARVAITDIAGGIAYSYVQTRMVADGIPPSYIRSVIQTCAADRLADCARTLMARIAENADKAD